MDQPAVSEALGVLDSERRLEEEPLACSHQRNKEDSTRTTVLFHSQQSNLIDYTLSIRVYQAPIVSVRNIRLQTRYV